MDAVFLFIYKQNTLCLTIDKRNNNNNNIIERERARTQREYQPKKMNQKKMCV